MKKSPLVRVPLIEALSNAPILQFLGKHDPNGHDLRAMLERGELRHFAAGQPIIREGEASDAMYVLVDGAIAVSLDGSELCVMDDPGDVFGEFGAVTGELRSATVTARNEVTCFTVSAQLASPNARQENSLFSRLLQQAIIKLLLARLRKSNEDLVEMKKALNAAETLVAFLRMDNEVLTGELDSARRRLRDDPRNTRVAK